MSDLSQALVDAAGEAVDNRLLAETGGCTCDIAYAQRRRTDPNCVYCQAGGAEFASDAGAVAVAAVLDALAWHTAERSALVGVGPRVAYLNHEELRRLAAEVREVSS